MNLGRLFSGGGLPGLPQFPGLPSFPGMPSMGGGGNTMMTGPGYSQPTANGGSGNGLMDDPNEMQGLLAMLMQQQGGGGGSGGLIQAQGQGLI